MNMKHELIKTGFGVCAALAVSKTVIAVIRPLLPEPVKRFDKLVFSVGTSIIASIAAKAATEIAEDLVDEGLVTISMFSKKNDSFPGNLSNA